MVKKTVSAKKSSSKKKNVGTPKINLKSYKKPSQKQWIIGGVVVAVLLFVVSGWLWWTKSFTNADKVFDDMLANNLNSTGVARKIEQKDQSSTVDQNVYVSFLGPEVTSQTRTVLSEKGQNRQTTTVTTETIGTQNVDLVRYVSAEGAEDLSIAGNLDKVLGVWGKRDPNKALGEQATFLNEAVFSLVPFGNLPKDKAEELLKFMDEKQVYEIKGAERSFEDGRYQYTYNVVVKPKELVEVLAKYVELSGVGSSAQLDPAAYESSAPITLRMSVDIFSRQLLKTEYLATGRVETYESLNLFRNVDLPAETIPFEELQNRLLGSGAAEKS